MCFSHASDIALWMAIGQSATLVQTEMSNGWITMKSGTDIHAPTPPQEELLDGVQL